MFSEFEIKRFRYAMARQTFMNILHNDKKNFVVCVTAVEVCTFLLGESKTPPFIDIFMEFDGLNWSQALANPVCGPMLKRVLNGIEQSASEIPKDRNIIECYKKALADTSEPTFDTATMNLLSGLHQRRR